MASQRLPGVHCKTPQHMAQKLKAQILPQVLFALIYEKIIPLNRNTVKFSQFLLLDTLNLPDL